MSIRELNRPDTITQRFRLLTILKRNHLEMYAEGLFDKGFEAGILSLEQLSQINDATKAALYLKRDSEGTAIKQTLQLKYSTPFVAPDGLIKRYQAYVAIGSILPESGQTDVNHGFNAKDLSIANRIAEMLMVEADTGYIPDLAPHLCDLKPNLPEPDIIVPSPNMIMAYNI